MELGKLLRAGTTDRLIGLYVILWNLAGSSLGTDLASQKKTVCGTEKFEARCPQGEVVVMETALYGRMEMGRCVRENYGRLGCSDDVRRYFDTLCSGKDSCSVKVPDDHLLAMKPCSELYSYLEASYSCVKVLSGSDYQASCREDSYVKVTQEQGVISSLVVSQLAAGGLHGCPWLIVVQPGQRVNITLMDFGPEIESDHRPTCHKYGIIRERGVDSHTTVCSGPQRERNIYLSQTNRVEMEFMLDSSRKFKADFLLKYNVVGCATPPLRGHTLARHTVSEAELHCPHTNRRPLLKCNGSNWVGYIEECAAPATSWSIWRVLSEEWSSPQGIAITVGLGVALGTVIGVSLLVCVLVFLKRHRMQKLAKAVKMAEYEEGEYGATEEISRKWSNSDTLKSIGYSRTDGTSSLYKDSQYSQVWNAEPVRMTNDSGFGEGRDLPSRPLTSMMKPTPASPGGLVDIYERSDHRDHVYERPK